MLTTEPPPADKVLLLVTSVSCTGYCSFHIFSVLHPAGFPLSVLLTVYCFHVFSYIFKHQNNAENICGGWLPHLNFFFLKFQPQ